MRRAMEPQKLPTLVLLAILMTIKVISCNCMAAKPCPVRAVKVFAPEGVKCACDDAYFGDKCQFRAQNVLAINASWFGVNDALLQWRNEPGAELFKLFTRKVRYDVSGRPTYNKWRGAWVKTPAMSQTAPHEVAMSRTIEYKEEATPTRLDKSLHLYLDSTFIWEIRLVLSSEGNKSASVFLDAPRVAASALQDKTSNSSGEAKCPFYRCPEKMFGFLDFFKSFKTACFKRRLVIDALLGMFGTFIFSILVYYSAVRFCSLCVKKEQRRLKLQLNCEKVTDKKTPSGPEISNLGSVNSSTGSVRIYLSYLESLQGESKTDMEPRHLKESKSGEFVLVSIPETVLREPNDETLSIATGVQDAEAASS